MQDTPSQTQQATEAKSGVVAFPLIARLLALGGAALFALAAWLPWVIVYTAPAGRSGVISSSVRLALTPATIGALPLNSMFGGARRSVHLERVDRSWYTAGGAGLDACEQAYRPG